MKTETKKKHPWDETMVIVVMIVSALCILIMLTDYIVTVGEAAKQPYNMATKSTVLSMLNSASFSSGPGKNICNVECTKKYEVCIAAYAGDKLVGCGERIYSDYRCLCTTPTRVTAALPTPPVPKLCKVGDYYEKSGRGFCKICDGSGCMCVSVTKQDIEPIRCRS